MLLLHSRQYCHPPANTLRRKLRSAGTFGCALARSRTVYKAVVHPPAHKVAPVLQALGLAGRARGLALHQLVVVVRVDQVPARSRSLWSYRHAEALC